MGARWAEETIGQRVTRPDIEARIGSVCRFAGLGVTSTQPGFETSRSASKTLPTAVDGTGAGDSEEATSGKAALLFIRRVACRSPAMKQWKLCPARDRATPRRGVLDGPDAARFNGG